MHHNRLRRRLRPPSPLAPNELATNSSTTRRLTKEHWRLFSPPPLTASAFRDRIQDVHSKTSSRLVCWIGEERVIDGGQREPGLVLRQEHLAGAPADGAASREPGQPERAKKVSTLGLGFKPRERDMQQWVIGKEI